MTKDRSAVLAALIEFSLPLETLKTDLRELPWDSDEEPAEVGPLEVIRVLERFVSEKLKPQEVEGWANLIEGREDIEAF